MDVYRGQVRRRISLHHKQKCTNKSYFANLKHTRFQAETTDSYF